MIIFESFSEKYLPHSGKYYADIGNGSNPNRIDWVVITPDKHSDGVVIVKKNCTVVTYSHNSMINKDFTKPLNMKVLNSTDEAYSKMMKWIGKMVKKDSRGRYFNNKLDTSYDLPENISDKELLEVRSKLLKL